MLYQRFQIRRDQLKYVYHWSVYRSDDPRLTGAPDSTLINRAEGYEVLAFINNLLRRDVWNGEPGLVDAHKIERLLKENVPGHLRSRHNISEWMITNWSRFV